MVDSRAISLAFVTTLPFELAARARYYVMLAQGAAWLVFEMM